MRWTICAFALAALMSVAGCNPNKPTLPPPGPPSPVKPMPEPAPAPDPSPMPLPGDPIVPAPGPVLDPAPAPIPAPAPGTGADNGPISSPTNTATNVRDRDPNAKTPLDQGNDEQSLKITATIRQRILGTQNMSLNAQNAKIITANRTVTLRGPVASFSEKNEIEHIAKDVAPEGFTVVNQLEIP